MRINLALKMWAEMENGSNLKECPEYFRRLPQNKDTHKHVMCKTDGFSMPIKLGLPDEDERFPGKRPCPSPEIN